VQIFPSFALQFAPGSDEGPLGGEADALDLGFLGEWSFRRENPRLSRLDLFGFPWILSSESRLINTLRGKSVENIFARLFLDVSRAAVDSYGFSVGRPGITHEASLAQFLIIRNQLSSELPLSAA
jgi:hypothetical protein